MCQAGVATVACEGLMYPHARRGSSRLAEALKLIMKLATVKTLACLIIFLAIHSASAACANDDPAAVAKSFYSKHANFSSEDPAKIKKIVTSRLFDALNRGVQVRSRSDLRNRSRPVDRRPGWGHRKTRRVRDGQQLCNAGYGLDDLSLHPWQDA